MTPSRSHPVRSGNTQNAQAVPDHPLHRTHQNQPRGGEVRSHRLDLPHDARARLLDETFGVLRVNLDSRRHDAVLIVERVQRSEEHTSELQSLAYLVCRLLLEKKKKNKTQ